MGDGGEIWMFSEGDLGIDGSPKKSASGFTTSFFSPSSTSFSFSSTAFFFFTPPPPLPIPPLPIPTAIEFEVALYFGLFFATTADEAVHEDSEEVVDHMLFLLRSTAPWPGALCFSGVSFGWGVRFGLDFLGGIPWMEV